MKKYWLILKYTISHKWYVMLECFREGLYWQGIMHDLDKFLPSMFFSYADFFYGGKTSPRGKTGYYKPFDTGNMAFEMAWHEHLHWNKHHWQWWIRHNDDGRTAFFPMPEKYLREMICDWVGAGKAQGFFSRDGDRFSETRKWYGKNKHKMQMAKETRARVEEILASPVKEEQ